MKSNQNITIMVVMILSLLYFTSVFFQLKVKTNAQQTTSIDAWQGTTPFLSDNNNVSHPLPSFARNGKFYVHVKTYKGKENGFVYIGTPDQSGNITSWSSALNDHGGGPHGYTAILVDNTPFHFRNGHIARYDMNNDDSMSGVTTLESPSSAGLAGNQHVWDNAVYVKFGNVNKVFHMGGWCLNGGDHVCKEISSSNLPLGQTFQKIGKDHPASTPGRSIVYYPSSNDAAYIFTTGNEGSENKIWSAKISSDGTLSNFQGLNDIPSGNDNGHGDIFIINSSIFAIRGSKVFKADINSADGTLSAWDDSPPDLPESQIDMDWTGNHQEGPSYGIIGNYIYVTGPKKVYYAKINGGNSVTATPVNTTPTITATPVPTQQAGVCPTTSNNQYETHETDSTSAENGLEAPVHPHKNINVYGYQLVQTGTKSLFDKSGLPQDAKAPQFSTVFSYTPTVVNLYKIYDWDSNQGAHLANDEVSMIGVGTNAGDVLHVPDAKFNLDSGKEEYGGPLVIVLYADDKSMTLKYTLQDDIVTHYTTYIDNICVDPNLLSTYKAADSGERWQNNQQARRRLPVLKGRQVIGTAKDKEVRLAVRNSGDVVDPRWKNGWWRDNPTSGGGGNNGPTATPLPTSYCSSSTKPEMEAAELPTSYPGKINIKWKKPNGVSKYTLKIDDMTSPFDDSCTSSNAGDICVNDLSSGSTSYQFDGEEGHSYHIFLSPIDVCGQTGSAAEQIISSFPAVSGSTCRIQGYRAVVGPIDQSTLKTSEGYYIDTSDANKSESIWVNDSIKSAKVNVSGVTANKSYQYNPYSFVLPVGSNYTVSIESVSGYNIYSKLSTEQNQTAQCSAISLSNSQSITVNCSANQIIKLWWYFVPASIPTTALTPTNSPPTPTPTAIPEISYCKEVQVNSQDKSNKLDIVILPDGYKTDTNSVTGSDADIQAAMADAKTAVDNFNQTNLSSQNKSKFNFWVNVNLGHDYEVKPNCNQIAGGHSVPCWNRDKAKEVQRLCEGDAYVVLKKSTYDSLIQTWKVAGLSYIGSKEALVFGGQMEATPHELCHSIAKCNDEYSYGVNAGSSDTPQYNCSEDAASSQEAPCPKWSKDGLNNAKCIQKCTFDNWYKAVDKSTMINQVESHDFSPPSLVMWENALKEYK